MYAYVLVTTLSLFIEEERCGGGGGRSHREAILFILLIVECDNKIVYLMREVVIKSLIKMP